MRALRGRGVGTFATVALAPCDSVMAEAYPRGASSCFDELAVCGLDATTGWALPSPLIRYESPDDADGTVDAGP